MANSRRKRLEREIDRDARVTTSGFVHEVVAATLGQLQRVSLASNCPDPVAMFDEVDAITRKFRNFHRRLNDARINRRGCKELASPSTTRCPSPSSRTKPKPPWSSSDTTVISARSFSARATCPR